MIQVSNTFPEGLFEAIRLNPATTVSIDAEQQTITNDKDGLNSLMMRLSTIINGVLRCVIRVVCSAMNAVHYTISPRVKHKNGIFQRQYHTLL